MTLAAVKAIAAPGAAGNFIDAALWIAQAQMLANNQ